LNVSSLKIVDGNVLGWDTGTDTYIKGNSSGTGYIDVNVDITKIVSFVKNVDTSPTTPIYMALDNTSGDAGTVVLRDSNGSDYYKIQILDGAFTVTKI